MGVILRPIFKVIMMIVLIFFTFGSFLMIQCLYFLWNFKFIEYSEFFTNKDSIAARSNLEKTVRDKNIKETLTRWWNLDFYSS